jgi:hypothetical protein
LLFPLHGPWIALSFLQCLLQKYFTRNGATLNLRIVLLFPKQILLSLRDNPALVDDILVDINKGVPVRPFQLFRFPTYKSGKDAIWAWLLRKTQRQSGWVALHH